MDNTFQQNQGDDGSQGSQHQGDQSQGQQGGGFQDDSVVQPEQPVEASQPFTPEPVSMPQVQESVVPAPVAPPMPQGGGSTGQGDDSAKDDKKKKENLPEVSDEEVDSFDMKEFDPSLKPDLTQLSDDSLGKALGTQGKQYDGGQMTAAQQYEDIINTPVPESNVNCDWKLFLELLAGSISLMYPEKKAIIGQIPKLSQFQVDELFKILKEEKKKFTQLNKKHQTELKKLEDKHTNPEEKEKLKEAENVQKDTDAEAAAELLRKLQGN